MKAWSVQDEYGVIVFAPTRGKAKSLGFGTAGFEFSEWCDIQVRRMPKIDGYKTEPCVLDWREDMRVYYEQGWWPMDGSPQCSRCERYEYDEIPESKVSPDWGDEPVCEACLKLQYSPTVSEEGAE